MTRKIVVTVQYNGDEEKFTISYVNPDATQTQMENAVTSLVGLTRNTYLGAEVTETYSL